MNYTNKHNLPAPLARALTPDTKTPVPGRYAVTQLIDSPLRRVLRMKYHGNITVDLSGGLWALLGKAIHHVIDKASEHNTEEKLEVKVGDATIVGIADYAEGVVIDWKVTSVYSFLLGEKAEWGNQLNVLRWLYHQKGRDIKALEVWAILRDWSQYQYIEATRRGDDYPPIPFIQASYPMVPLDETHAYVMERLRLHQEAEAMIDSIESIPACSKEERWERPTVWKVKSPGAKRALRVLPTKTEAEVWLSSSNSKTGHVVEVRGESVRCMRYCDVVDFCPYKSEYTQDEEGGKDANL